MKVAIIKIHVADIKFAHDSSIKVPVFSPLLQDILVKLNINSSEDFEDSDKISILERDF